MDYSDPDVGKQIRQHLDGLCDELHIQYHGVRFRNVGYHLRVEIHLLFPHDTAVGEAHRLATQLEERLPQLLDMPAEIVTHLESLEDHARVHSEKHYTGLPG
jgi:divalent metal cation (Fe/Co/Zn/Cd) transporter